MADDAALIVRVKADTEEMKTKIANLQAELAKFAASASANTAKVERSVSTMTKSVGAMSSAMKGITSSLGAFGISAHTCLTILKGMVEAWNHVDQSAKRAAEAAREHRQEVEKTIQYNNSLVEKLNQLSDLSQDNYLNADGIRTANTLVQELTKSYGDLGIQVDQTTGKITGMTDAVKNIQGQDAERRKSAIEQQLSALRRQLSNAQAAVDEYDQDTFGGQFAQDFRMMSKDFGGYMGNVLTGNFDRYNAEQQGVAIKERDAIQKEITDLTNELARLNDNATLDQIAKEMEKARQNAEEQKYLRGLQANTNAGKLEVLHEQYNKTMEIFVHQMTEARRMGDEERFYQLRQQMNDYKAQHKAQRDALQMHGEGGVYDATVAGKQDAYIRALQSGDRSVIETAKKEYEDAEQARLRTVAAASGQDVQKAQEAYDARLRDYNNSEGASDARRADLWKLVQEAEKDLMSKRQHYEQTTLQAYKPPQEAAIQGGAAGTFNAFGIQSILQKNLAKEQLDELKNISSLIQQSIDQGNPVFV